MSESGATGGRLGSCGEVAAAFLILGLLAISGLYFLYVRNQKAMRVQEQQAKQQLQARRAKIRASELGTSDFRLSGGFLPELTGRIANHATRDSVSMVDFLITVYDCPSARSDLDRCSIVASDSAVAWRQFRPARPATSVPLSRFRPRSASEAI
jgi:Tfp pilus assembly protein PilW